MKKLAIILFVILFIWAILTIWVERTGERKLSELGDIGNAKHALIIYDPDPFYNLDEKVCQSFGESLSEEGYHVTIATVAAAHDMVDHSFKLYVFCANTYNWRPDWAVTSYIRNVDFLEHKPVVAIVLGAGSTEASQQAFTKMILDKKALLIDSKSLWLLRPNDDSRMDESNVSVAISQVAAWAKEISKQIN